MVSLTLVRSDFKYLIKDVVARARGRGGPKLRSRVPVRQIKRLIAEKGLALIDGQPSWFYTAYSRGDSDPLTNYTLDWIKANVAKDSAILNTGCGTGIMLFWLMDQGFNDVDGFDYLNECVEIANQVGDLGSYDARIWRDDGFKPEHLSRSYDVITVMHWLYSAWGGNYGNPAVDDPRSPDVRERLLSDFISNYAKRLNPGGVLILELVDAIADRRVPGDHPYLSHMQDSIYPVRHDPDQVERSATASGLGVERLLTCVSYSHQPRTTYWLRAPD
jgi:SAM-dependent methyltransferase